MHMGRKRIIAAMLSWTIVLSMILPQGTVVFAAQIPSDDEETLVVDETLTEDEVNESADEAAPEQVMELLPEEEKLELKDEAADGILTDQLDADQAFLSQGELSVEGDGSVGQMLADKLGGKLAEQEQNNGCFIRSLSVSGSTANVEYETLKNCTLIVCIYTEDGKQLLGSGSKEVERVDTKASVTIDISNMPQYFYVKAFLADTYEKAPLCSAFGSPEYTEDMQKLRKSTINDYDSSRVLNLDYSSSTNFLVYDAGVKQISEEAEKNRITKNGTNQYQIAGADSSVTGLKTGDIAAFRKENGEIIIVKVKTISTAGTTVIITSDTVEMEQAFDYVKIESEGDMDETTVDNSGCDPGVTVVDEGNTMTGQEGSALLKEYPEEGEESLSEDEAAKETDPDELFGDGIDIETTKSVSYAIDKKFGDDANNVTLSGVVDFASAVKAKVEITPQNQYMEINIEYTAGLRLKASGHLQGSIKLGKFIVAPVPGVFIEFTPSLIAELSASFEMSGTLTGGAGFKVDGKSGITNTSRSPELAGEIKGEITLFLGFSMEPEVAILCEQFANAGLTAKAGVEANAVMSTNQSEDHLCGNRCVAGKLYGRLSLSASASFLNNRNLTFEYTMLDVKIPITDFYYSLMFQDFGWTKCPHLKEDKEYAKMAEMPDTGKDELEFYTGWWKRGEVTDTDVKRYKGNSAAVKIPSIYTYTSSDGKQTNYKVVGIATWAFADQANITSVYVPDSVNYIESGVFMGSPKLTKVRLPHHLSHLGSAVFEDCKSLQSIHIPSGINALGEDMFSGCISLKNVELTGELESIGYNCFNECKSLKQIDLPYSIWKLGAGAFAQCTALTDITLPARDIQMGSLLFYGDTALRSVDVSHQSVIPERCFDGCTALKTVGLSSKLTEIGKEAFKDCGSISSIVLPDSLQVLGEYAFWRCKGLKKIYIPKGIKKCAGHENVFDGAGGGKLHVYFGGSKKQFEAVMGKVANYTKVGINVTFNASPKNVSGSGNDGSSVYSDEGMYDEDGAVPDETGGVGVGNMSRNFTGLKANTLYNVYYVRSVKAFDFYAADNLLYVDQLHSDAGGNLTVTFVPRENVKGAEYLISAFKSLEDDGKDDPDNPVTGIKLNKKEAFVKPGKSLQLKVTITPDNAADKTVTWSTSKKSVATVSSEGKVTAKAAGTAVIRARTSNGKTAACKIKVPGIKLNDTVLYIQKGKTSTAIKATCTNDSVRSVSSGKKAVATAVKSGKKIKIKGIKPGKATITVKTKRGLTKKFTVNVQTGKVVTKKLTVSEGKVTLKGKNKKTVITVKATPNALSTGQKIKASSSNKKIATASFSSKTGKLTITSKKKGKCKVTVSAGKIRKTIKVTVR